MTIADQSISEFLDTVASGTVAPAGGSVIGVTGAMGAALCEMACVHAIEHRDAADEALVDARNDCNRLRRSLLSLADADAAVVTPFVAGEHKGETDRVAEEATRVPLEIAESCLRVVENAIVATEQTASGAALDAAVGAMLAAAALEGSVAIVRANVDRIDDPTVSEPFSLRANELERTGESTLSDVLQHV